MGYGRLGRVMFWCGMAVLLVGFTGANRGGRGSARHARAASENIRSSYGRLPLHFEPNQGQFDPRARFRARGDGYSLYLTPAEAVFVLNRREGGCAKKAAPGEVLRLRLVGGDRRVELKGRDRLPGQSNYLTGRSSSQWRTGIPHFAQVRLDRVYPGIDMVYYGNQRRLEYDFVVRPGADPKVIALEADGARSMRVDRSGRLVLQMGKGTVAFDAPVAYQEQEGKRRVVASRYVIGEGRRIGFEVGFYDPTRPLVIDPVLDYSTFLGGTGWAWANGVAVDVSGNAYVVGFADVGFPSTYGAFQPVSGGQGEAFVTKLDATASTLVYSTFLGGSSDDGAYDVAVDPSGNAYVVGYSKGNFPTTNGAFQAVFGGGADGNADAFVAKLNPSGSALVYSTYVGGTGSDEGRALALDATGNVYVTGTTTGAFPTTAGSFQTTPGGGKDVWIAKLNPSGTALTYSTYLGGSGTEGVGALAVDGSGCAFVTGQTDGVFPTTVGAYQVSVSSGQNVFVTKLNAAGSALAYSTYLGGNGGGMGGGLAVDGGGCAYVTGTTAGGFPTTSGAYQTVYAGGSSDFFVSKLNAAGSSLLYSTYLGGADSELGGAIALDASGNAYVTGWTWGGIPTTAGAFETAFNGLGEAVVVKLNAAGNSLVYSTHLGGTSSSTGRDIALDPSGNVYVVGEAFGGFPTTPEVQQSVSGGEQDVFTAKFDRSVFLASGVTPTPTPENASPSFPLKEPPPKGGSYVAPQPARGPAATVAYWMGENGTVEIRVFNAVGQWVSSKRETKPSGPQTSSLDLSGFAPGVYLYQIRFSYDSGGTGSLPVGKFMVTR